MTREELRGRFEQVVEMPEGTVQDGTPLEDIEMWDSVSMMSFIALADEAGVILTPRQIRDCRTVGDLLDLIGTTA